MAKYSTSDANTAWRWLKKPGRWLAVISLILPLVAWELISRWSGLPAFLLPSPGQVLARFGDVLADGSLLRHTGFTLLEVLLGLALGSWLATITGYTLARSPLLE